MGKAPVVIQALPELSVLEPDRVPRWLQVRSRSGPGSRRLPAPLLAGFFEIAVRAKSLHKTLFVHDLLQALESPFDSFTLLNLDLNHGRRSHSLPDQGPRIRAH